MSIRFQPRSHPKLEFPEISMSRVGVHLILDFTTDTIQFFEITSAVKGYGEKMVRAVMTALPEEEWEACVVMDWSEGFWERMAEKYDGIEVL